MRQSGHREIGIVFAGLLLACTPQPGIEGELVVHVVDLGDHSETLLALRLDGGETRALALPAPTSLPGGTRVRVQGTDDGRTIHGTSLEAMGGQAQALTAGTKKRDRTWAFVLLDTGGGVNLSKAEAEKILFGQDRLSIRGYYEEVSYGLQAVTGKVFGPIKVTVQGSLCDVNTMSTQVINQAGPQITEKFDQYLWYIGRPIGGCPWNGAAEQGRAVRPTQNSFFNASTLCSTLAQEPGHNFGMVHSSGLVCRDGGKGVSLPTSANSQCAHIEYGNPFDPMGRGCGHMNGIQKAYQEWLEGCNVVKVTKSGTFTLFPLEQPCNGVQLLQVPTPSRTFRYGTGQSATISSFYLELRTPTGFDATAIGRGDLGDGTAIPTGVYVIMGADIRGVSMTGNPNWLLDMTPGSRGAAASMTDLTDGALPAGKSFTDPTMGGPTITVVSADATRAVIRVELAGSGAAESPGEGLCLDGQSFTAPGPVSCSTAPIMSADAGAADATPAAPAPDAAEPPPQGGSSGRDAGADRAAMTGGKTGSSAGTGGAGGDEPGAPPAHTASGGCSFATGDGSLAAFALVLVGLWTLRGRRARS